MVAYWYSSKITYKSLTLELPNTRTPRNSLFTSICNGSRIVTKYKACLISGCAIKYAYLKIANLILENKRRSARLKNPI